MSILQGTTPQLIITVPKNVPLTAVIGIELTLSHKGGKNIYSAEDVDVDTTANTITYTFTETQTLAFDPAFPVVWQLRLKTSSGILGTLKQQVNVSDLINDEVMA